jgi:hypothetical protein
MGRTGKMFVPFMVAFCEYSKPHYFIYNALVADSWNLATVGWPFLMKGLINANNGVRAPVKEKEKARKSSKMGRKNAIDSEAWSQRVPA